MGHLKSEMLKYLNNLLGSLYAPCFPKLNDVLT